MIAEAVKRTADDDSSRIVGGEEALPNSVPFQCNLIIDDAYFCGCKEIIRLYGKETPVPSRVTPFAFQVPSLARGPC